MNNLFWFRQDLRIDDNKWLSKCINESQNIVPIFIFDQEILDNISINDKRINYLIWLILNLNYNIRLLWWELILFYWKPIDIIPKVVTILNLQKVYTNRSYWYYWVQKQSNINSKLLEINKWFELVNDYLLVSPNKIKPYKIFTPFFKSWLNVEKNTLETEMLSIKFQKQQIEKLLWQKISLNNKKIINFVQTKYASKSFFNMEIINNDFSKIDFENYDKNKNYLYINWTSKLSISLNNWWISIRKLYNYVSKFSENIKIPYIRQLAWREFWNHLVYHFPKSYLFEFQDKKIWLKWKNNEKYFNAWCEGKTGYPIVDAAILQLKEENWMHGRARMIVASFLTKNLHIDRRWWETFFKKYLLDYDSNVNIWNWQWVAWVWADPRPLRIFNPILQTIKFDPNCIFIKKYINSLMKYNSKDIIYNPSKIWYTKPIVDLKISAKKFKEFYYQNANTI